MLTAQMFTLHIPPPGRKKIHDLQVPLSWCSVTRSFSWGRKDSQEWGGEAQAKADSATHHRPLPMADMTDTPSWFGMYATTPVISPNQSIIWEPYKDEEQSELYKVFKYKRLKNTC